MKTDFIQKMFPGCCVDKRGTEVNGLSGKTVPQGVEILASWNDKHVRDNERRELYLVSDNEYMALLRICTAMEGSGYDEYAVIHEIEYIHDAFPVLATADRWMNS